MTIENEDGSLAGMSGMVICFALVGMVFIALGFVVDKIINITNYMQALTGLPQDAVNTIYFLGVIFAALPFMYLIALVINYLSTSADTSGGVA